MSEIMIAVSRTRDRCIPSARIRAFMAVSMRSEELAMTIGDAVDRAGVVAAAQAATPARDTASRVKRNRVATEQRCIAMFFKAVVRAELWRHRI